MGEERSLEAGASGLISLSPPVVGFCLQQRAGLARRASYFLLLAQKKVTKEEGLNTICLAAVARSQRRLLRGHRVRVASKRC